MGKEKEIQGSDLDWILSWTPNDICASLISKCFSRDGLNEPKFYTNDYFKLPTSKFETKREGYTTIGIYICNLHLIQPNFAKIFGYINKPFDGKVISSIESKLSEELYNDRITTDQFADYLNRVQWLGGNEVMEFITPSLTPALLKPDPSIIKKKEKLFKENKKELENGNAIVGSEIEKELIKDAEEYLKKDEGYENFASKSKINIGNNYKNINIMKGPLQNTFDGKYRINKSEYNTGISKEEYASFADSSVLGTHSRAVGVATGGYMANKMRQSLNPVAVGPKGSDCGTKQYLKVKIYPEMKQKYLNRYILGNDGKLVELTSDNIDNYVNKIVQMRSPMFCHMKAPHYCNICTGNQPFLLNLTNFGLAIPRAGTKLLNMKLKKFHDLTVKVSDIDLDTIFKFRN